MYIMGGSELTLGKANERIGSLWVLS